ncbi:hypothetical protein AMECASPLE_039389 [Ameca splendens]|uniref:Uncharacterized protein n=1 Tax=Ameca splendens TaxID=208324 RepID=A0ABV0ZW38_9TELE
MGLGALVCASSLLVAACQGLGPWALSGLLGSDVIPGSRISGLHGWTSSVVGSHRQGLWARRCSSLRVVVVVPVVVLLGQVFGSSHSLLHIFMEKPCIHKNTHTQTHRSLDSGVNRYTSVLF